MVRFLFRSSSVHRLGYAEVAELMLRVSEYNQMLDEDERTKCWEGGWEHVGAIKDQIGTTYQVPW